MAGMDGTSTMGRYGGARKNIYPLSTEKANQKEPEWAIRLGEGGKKLTKWTTRTKKKGSAASGNIRT